MKIKLEKREPLSIKARIILPFIAVFISFIFSFLLILIAGVNPFTAFYYIFQGALGTKMCFLETLVKTTPLILTGLAVGVAFKAKFYNLGAEGQFYIGALSAAVLGIYINLPVYLTIPIIMFVGFLSGGIYALFAGILKAKLKVDEVVVTLLSNYIIIYIVSALLDGPLKDPKTMWPNSPAIFENSRYPIIIQFSRLHFGFIISIMAVIIIWFIMKKTTLGFEIKAVGANPKASQFAGINIPRTIIITSLLSGGLAGLAGVGEVCGLQYQLIEKISPGYGYAGIVIAMLGRLEPVGIMLASLLFGIIITGAQMMSRITGVPVFLADVIQGIVLIVMLAVFVFTNYKLNIKK